MKETMESAGCDRENDLISFLYHELAGRELREFQQHLNGCSSCSAELGSFQNVRAGVVAWRQESLGLSVFAAKSKAARMNLAKPSAVAAFRQFFALSPVWLKGAAAFASLLLLVALIWLVMKSGADPEVPLVKSAPVGGVESKSNLDFAGKVYSEAEMRAKVEAGVQERLAELRAVDNNPVSDKQPPLIVVRQSTPITKPTHTAKTRRSPLTKAEREQLAADLRLISPTEDSDLDLLGEHINNR